MDFASPFYGRLLANSDGSYVPEPSETLMNLPEPFRARVRGADRRALVDFVNTLVDMSCNTACKELWNADASLWAWYSNENLIRSLLYTDEIGIDSGIELEESNWNAVRQALEVLPACGVTSVDDARDLIRSLPAITEIQRAALLQVLKERERYHGLCNTWGDFDRSSPQAVRGIEDKRYIQDSLRTRVDTLKSDQTCGSTALYDRPPLDLTKPESTEGGRRVSVLKRQEGAPVLLG